ncbi:ABC transporter ATP-binding protein [Metamycoplasma buccale]|uniref:ABC transporter ATP-binding protein n=1 Tax=Metamycoplasma buccale TaxID=55602 RepID=UPI00398EC798
MFRILKLLKAKYKWLAVVTLLLTIFETFAFLFTPTFIGQIVSLVALEYNKITHPFTNVEINILLYKTSFPTIVEALKFLGLSFGITLLIGAISGMVSTYLSSYISIGGSRDIRSYLWNHIESLSQKDIELFTNAKILTRFTIDVNRIQMGIQMALKSIILGPVQLTLGLVLSLLSSLKLSAVFGAMIPLLFLIMGVLGLISMPLFKKEQKLNDNINIESQENILGVKVIKSFNLEENQWNKFKNVNETLGKTSGKSWLVFNLMFIMVMLIANLASLAILATVGYTSRGITQAEYQKQISNINAFINYVMIVTMGVIMTIFVLFYIYRARISAKRIFEILDKEPDIKFITSDKKVTEGKIKFDHVSFRYYENSEKNVLEDITFEANPGEIIGIIGPTGSGKSTIAKLLNLDFKTQYGKVLIDNNNIQEIDTLSLRQNISHVYQVPTILSGTIKSNLLFANENASDNDMIQATKISCAYEYINRFPKKYDHEVEQKGANLSGGQKQRLSIAQGVIRKPKILILDDSTSALDAKTESLVRKNIREAFKETGITTVIIAQKISSIIDANKIIVLHHGKISDIGTHQELMKKNKLYKEIALTQLGGEHE